MIHKNIWRMYIYGCFDTLAGVMTAPVIGRHYWRGHRYGYQYIRSVNKHSATCTGIFFHFKSIRHLCLFMDGGSFRDCKKARELGPPVAQPAKNSSWLGSRLGLSPILGVSGEPEKKKIVKRQQVAAFQGKEKKREKNESS